ncbi:MAG: DUF3892 domain-containing protein [Anaerolineae bacterium]|nr:DUF3892 domain-containing protein [Anaerolineae bacterium]
MSVRITHIRKPDANSAVDAISHYKWINEANNETGSSTRQDMVAWLDSHPSEFAYVGPRPGVRCVVKENRHGTRYLQTVANGQETDNLLKLPQF